MVTVSDAELANKIQQLRDHGAVKSIYNDIWAKALFVSGPYMSDITKE